MKKPSLPSFIKKFLPLIIIVIILGVAAINFFTMRTPKVEPLTAEQKQDFINYVDANKVKPLSKKEKQDFAKTTPTTQPITPEEKDSFLKSIR